MAERYAVASGDWSNTATWDGGTLPGASDDVYPNNFTVNVDQNISVNSLRNVAGATAASGGWFEVTAAVTIDTVLDLGDTHVSNSPGYLISLDTGAGNTTITAPNIEGNSGTSSARAIRLFSGYTATLTLNATALRGGTSNSQALYISAPCTIVINADCTSVPVTAAAIYSTVSTATITITGDITSGSIDCLQLAGGTLSITGDITGGTGSTVSGVLLFGAGSLDFTGNLYAGSGTGGVFGGCPAVYTQTSTMKVRINGDIYVGGTPSGQGNPGFFPILGPFTLVSGSAIHALDDADFPTSNAGDDLALGAGGGGVAPTNGVGWPPRQW